MKSIMLVLKKFINYIVVRKGVYLLTTFVVLAIGFFFIYKGNNSQKIFNQTLFVSIGTSLIASGIVAILDIWREVLKDNIFRKTNNIILQGGLEYIHSKRDLDKYDDLIKNAKNSIDITGYSLRAFYQSYGDILPEKIKDNPSLKIRMLVVDPDSLFSRNRDMLEHNDKESGAFKFQIDDMKCKFKHINNIEIRKINAPLTTMIYRIDDIMFFGPHFHKRSSKATITYEVSEHGWLFKEYIKEFERLWLNSYE